MKTIRKTIIYYVQRYRPAYEAISKEVAQLQNHFANRYNIANKYHTQYHVTIHDLHLDGIGNFTFQKKMKSYHFILYPLLALHTHLASRKSAINHIYTSLGDLPYLSVLNLKNTILTAAASSGYAKIKKRKSKLKKMRKIIVESERQKKQLLSIGINEQKIEIIYPPVDLDQFSYARPRGKFTVLYASCPTRESDFEKRGIPLILDTAKKSPSVQFHLAWRGGGYPKIQELIKRLMRTTGGKNVTAKNEIITDMNLLYGSAHCTIIPYTKYDDFLKLIPNSALESLASGKPLLVSSKTEIARIVETEQCGVVFEPTPEGLSKAVRRLQQNYAAYQKNCRKTAEKYFSKKVFLQKYETIYEQILNK